MTNENKNTTNATNNVTNQSGVGKKRDYILDGAISEETVRKASEFILEINRYDEEQLEKDESYKSKPINLIVNTYGGSLYDANMLIGIIRLSQTPVHTKCHGKAMSAGLYIFASGHRRFATPLATFMYHDGSVGMHDTIHGLSYTLLKYEELRDRYNEFIADMTNIPLEKMQEKNRIKEDWYMTAKEALDLGLVDELLKF